MFDSCCCCPMALSFQGVLLKLDDYLICRTFKRVFSWLDILLTTLFRCFFVELTLVMLQGVYGYRIQQFVWLNLLWFLSTLKHLLLMQNTYWSIYLVHRVHRDSLCKPYQHSGTFCAGSLWVYFAVIIFSKLQLCKSVRNTVFFKSDVTGLRNLRTWCNENATRP